MSYEMDNAIMVYRNVKHELSTWIKFPTKNGKTNDYSVLSFLVFFLVRVNNVSYKKPLVENKPEISCNLVN